MSAKHVYKCLRLRGYNYQGLFRGIHSASPDGQRAHIRWNNNWVAFLDAMLQMQLLSNDSTQLYVPTSIQKLVVDTRKQMEMIRTMPDKRRLFEATRVPELDVITTGSVEVRGMFATPIARRRTLAEPVLERHAFVPFGVDEGAGEGAGEEMEEEEAARVCVQLVLENRAPVTRASPPVRVAELLSPGATTPLVPHVLAALADLPLVRAKATVFVGEGAVAPPAGDPALAGATVADLSTLAAERDVAFLLLDASTPPDALVAAAATLGAGGCALVRVQPGASAGTATALRTAAASAGLQLAARFRLSTNAGQVLVFRKGGWRADPSQLRVVRVPEMSEAFEWVARLQDALKEPNPAEKRVVLVARGPLNGALGLFNCLRQEPGAGQHLARLYLFPEEADTEATAAAWEDPAVVLTRLRPRLELDLAVNIMQGGRWGCMRHLPLSITPPPVLAKHAYSNTAVRGDLSSFAWFQGRVDLERLHLAEDEVLVHIDYAALNFRDVMMASTKLDVESLACTDADCGLGFEFSGRLSDGHRVMGMRMGGSTGTVVVANRLMIVDVPPAWTLEEAATVPVAYATAIFALEMVGGMVAGESVLVHAASGAVGQAAIRLALARGCRVFATVGTQRKRDFLLATFPRLCADDIGNSRDTSFEPLVLSRTAGRGVDLVLNSLADDKLQASLRCLAERGRFLEIGKVDMFNNSSMGMRMLLRQVSVHGIVLDNVLASCDKRLLSVMDRMQQLVNEGIALPINTEVFGRDQVDQAYRHMAAGKHVGKVLIKVREDGEGPADGPPTPLVIPARPRFYCQPDAAYVLVGGLGGLGLELAHWLVQRGARHLVLTSRRGITTGYQARRLMQWRQGGVRALVRTDDTATLRGAEALLRAAATAAPAGVAAIFNLAVVLRDALFENQTAEAFAESFHCKATAAVRLDAASRRLCPKLRHFVLFSSVSCGRGNAGQTNYGLSNSVMERLAHARRADGLPATAIQWGAVGDVGLVADMRDDDRVLEIGGTLQQSLHSCLDVLDGFLAGRPSEPVLASMVVAEKRAGAAADDLVSSVAALLGFRDLKALSMESTLAELGMDSMMAVEIQQTLARDFDLLLTPQDVRSLTFGRLREMQRAKEAKERKAREAPTSASDLAKEAVTPVSAVDPTTTGDPTSAPAVEPVTTAVNGDAVSTGGDFASEALRVLVGSMQDEKSAAEPVVVLGTAEVKSTVAGGPVAVAIPGVEGVATGLVPLAQGLNTRVVALQLPLRGTEATVPDILDVLMPHLRQHMWRGKDLSLASSGFLLLGYSFGGLLALEAAARLEKEGDPHGPKGHLVLLDSAPGIMSAMASQVVGGGRNSRSSAMMWASLTTISANKDDGVLMDRVQETQFQIEILVQLMQTVSPDITMKTIQRLREVLSMQKDWEARRRIFCEWTVHIKHSMEYKMMAVDAIYRRCLSAICYSWPKGRPRLRAAVTLVRPTLTAIPPGTVPEDGGLSQICERPVRVLYVEGADHYSLPSKKQTTVLVNKILEEAKCSLASDFQNSISSMDINNRSLTISD